MLIIFKNGVVINIIYYYSILKQHIIFIDDQFKWCMKKLWDCAKIMHKAIAFFPKTLLLHF